MQLHIKADGVPIYRQISNQIRYRILSKQLEVGVELPSIRILAETLRVNPNTVARAFRELENDGFVQKHHARATYVSKIESSQANVQRMKQLQPHLDAILLHSKQLGFSLAQLKSQLTEREAFLSNSTLQVQESRNTD